MTTVDAARVIEVESVSLDARLRRRTVPVLREVSFTAERGQRLALSGRSGSGKSSVCTLLAGLRRPSTGTVHIDGTAADRVQDWSAVSYLTQHPSLEPVLTIGENLAVAGHRAGGDAEDVTMLLGLGRLADRRPPQLSEGERQRAALARALLGGRRVVVLDEPTSAQDSGHLALVPAATDRAAAAGSCVVIATHDPRVLEHCDTVINLADGRIR